MERYLLGKGASSDGWGSRQARGSKRSSRYTAARVGWYSGKPRSRSKRAAASRSEGYHLALAVALALAPLAVEPAAEHAFVTAFLDRWGRALETGGRRRGR
jgi:hypothetical protein